MSAAWNCEFKMESRPYGDGYTNFAGITCGWCHTELWLPAKDAGWAIRIFRANRWKVGNRPAQHRCPTCFGKARLGRKPVDNPAIPKEIGKLIKEKIIATQAPGVTLTLAEPAPQEAQDGPPAAEAPTIQASRQSPPERAPRGGPGVRATSGQLFTRRDNARRSAQLTCGPKSKDGVDFFVMPADGGWVWRLASEITEAERAVWTRRYRKHHATEGTPMANAPDNVTPIRKDPMPAPDAKPTDIRQPTREERGKIHDELTRIYDTVDERYAASGSDKDVAARLNMPRAWVTDIRSMFFGDHDRNQVAAAKVAKLDEAIALAKAATSKLLQMAQDAEALERDLVTARKQLEG